MHNFQSYGRYVLIAIFLTLIVYSLNRIEVSKRAYAKEIEERQRFMAYKPVLPELLEISSAKDNQGTDIKGLDISKAEVKEVDIQESDIPKAEADDANGEEIDNQETKDEGDISEETFEEEPTEEEPTEEEPERLEGKPVNPSILELQEINQDVVGWVTVPGTQVDYYFMWAKDYETYIRTDINGQYSYAGSIFMDYRCDMNLRGAKTILYGHNMKNNSMFGSLANYKSQSFFLENQRAYINLPYYNLELELVSCMVVKADDAVVFGIKKQDVVEEAFIKALAKNNVHGKKYVPKDLSIEDRFVLFSTCDYEGKESRTVVAFRIIEESVEDMNIRGR